MNSYQLGDLKITLYKQGSTEFTKVSYPIRYGTYSEIRTKDHLFQFNLNGEIKTIQGLGNGWPDPSEWLKRTVGNDWVYYSTGGYSGVYDAFGEYYLPCPAYTSNAITLSNPFDDDAVKAAIDSWQELQAGIHTLISNDLPKELSRFLNLVSRNGPDTLKDKAVRFHRMVGERVSVLPPDTRHVDYDVIPLTAADGCLYKCGFCRVKSRQVYTPRSKDDILQQIAALKEFYGPDIRNYNSVFLGQHDALNCDSELIIFAAEAAHEEFELAGSHMKGANLFLFGSADALIKSDNSLFDALERLPYTTYINIGLESPDAHTLAFIRKAITPETVENAFSRILDINRQYDRIEITTNFLFGDELPPTHMPAFMELMDQALQKPFRKGTIYLSPLADSGSEKNRGMVRKFYKIKALCPLPAFIYLIQRL